MKQYKGITGFETIQKNKFPKHLKENGRHVTILANSHKEAKQILNGINRPVKTTAVIEK